MNKSGAARKSGEVAGPLTGQGRQCPSPVTPEMGWRSPSGYRAPRPYSLPRLTLRSRTDLKHGSEAYIARFNECFRTGFDGSYVWLRFM